MKTVVNLLPLTTRRERLLRRRSIQWCIVLCALLSTLVAARWFKQREFIALNEQLDSVSREGRPAQVMLREITDMRQQIERLQQHEAVAKELEQQRQVLVVLGLVSQAARETGGMLRVTNLQAVDLQSFHEKDGHPSEEPKIGTLRLIGVSLDSPSVAEFHDALLRSGLFGNVKLVKSNERQENGLSLYDYEVSCEL